MPPIIDPTGNQGMPGFSTRVDSDSREFRQKLHHFTEKGIQIHKDTQDTENSVVTKLRPGLALVRVEAGANAGLYVHAEHSDAPAAADVVDAVLLTVFLNMLGRDGAVENKSANGMDHGFVTEDQVLFGTDDASYIDAIKAALPLVKFES